MSTTALGLGTLLTDEYGEVIVSGEETPRLSPKEARKEERNRRLEEQLRDNLRKRKELSRARKMADSEAAGTAAAAENGSGDD